MNQDEVAARLKELLRKLRERVATSEDLDEVDRMLTARRNVLVDQGNVRLVLQEEGL